MTYPRTSGAKKAVNKHNALQEKIPCSGEESKPLNQGPNSVGKIPALAGQTLELVKVHLRVLTHPRSYGADFIVVSLLCLRTDLSPR